MSATVSPFCGANDVESKPRTSGCCETTCFAAGENVSLISMGGPSSGMRVEEPAFSTGDGHPPIPAECAVHEFLYVCLFSNGSIKVGRSIDPASRVAAHVERVACLNVTLVDSGLFPTRDAAAAREALLLDRCAEAAITRSKSEWFLGLDFRLVCVWASDIAYGPLPKTPSGSEFGALLCMARKAAGLTQTELGVGIGAGGRDLLKAAISSWEVGTATPNVHQLRLICQRLHVSADSLLNLPKA